MGRPPREDRKTVSNRYIGVRVNQYEYDMLLRCIDEKNRQMVGIGLPALMTPTSFLKFLIDQEARRLVQSEDATKRRTALAPYRPPEDEAVAVAEPPGEPYGKKRARAGDDPAPRKRGEHRKSAVRQRRRA